MLSQKLGLESHGRVENLVITAIYAGLLEATLDPKRQAVQVTSIAPLRDLSPGAIPEMISILDLWSGRCTSTLGDLEAQILEIRSAAADREKEAGSADKRLQAFVDEIKDTENKRHDGPAHQREALARRAISKRGQQSNAQDYESMELDDSTSGKDRRSSKRKI